jgi:hypothetical protein
VIVSRSLTVEKSKITMQLLISALFHDLTQDKTITISGQSERRERDLQELLRRAKKPVSLCVDDAHDLNSKALVVSERLAEVVGEGGGQHGVRVRGGIRGGLSLRIDDLEPRLTRSVYDVRSLVEQFEAKPAEIRRLFTR